MNYAYQQDAAAKMQGGIVGGLNTPVKADGLTTCLQRIQELTGQLYANNERLAGLAVRIGGHEPENALKDNPPQPMPDNALFLAKQIENSIGSIIDFQRYQMNRIDNAIS